MAHCDQFWFSVCVFCWLMTCALSIFSVLDNFCKISPLHSNAVWITRVLHLICNAHIHILLFGSKFHIILAMYVQMCMCIYTLCSKKSDAKIKITITTAHLIRIKYPLSSFNYRLSGTNVANFNKIHHMVSEQQLFKQEAPLPRRAQRVRRA